MLITLHNASLHPAPACCRQLTGTHLCRHRICQPCCAYKDHKDKDGTGGSDKHVVPKFAKRSKQRGQLRLFLDSADVNAWETWAQTGALYGFTTNPAILKQDKVPNTLEAIAQLAQKAHELHAKELQVQAWGADADSLLNTAMKIREIDPDLITVKIPCTCEGLQAASRLMALDSDACITMTAVYQPSQVMAAQAIGADYVAPYLGRMADTIGAEEAIQQVVDMQDGVYSTGSCMRVLVASIRNADVMAKLHGQGLDTFTFSPAVMEEVCSVGPTLKVAKEFDVMVFENTPR
eukprot:jgi/Chrzof1/3325/Cz12g20290.t1